jgi:GMP synthase (glutamine-hydrolysing)
MSETVVQPQPHPPGPATAGERGGIVVLDFGGQYTQLIARRVRELQVFSAILPCTAPLEQIRRYEPAGVVLSGGPSSVYDPGAPACDPGVLSLGIPVLGICYGLQWIAHTLGGRVQRAERREYGPAELDLRDGSPLFAGLPARLKIWTSHGDHVLGMPSGFQVTGATGNALSAAEDRARRIFAVQFHPEVQHTERGSDILRNFVFGICGTKPNWSGASFIAETVEAIRGQIGSGRALCALSGGVDSAVAAALVQRAIGIG